MRQTMAMLTLLMCSVAASVASLSLSARLPSESEWSMAEREMLKCCPATGSASCSWSRSLQLCLAAPLLMALLHFTTLPTPSTLSLSVQISDSGRQFMARFDGVQWQNKTTTATATTQTQTQTMSIWMKTSKCPRRDRNGCCTSSPGTHFATAFPSFVSRIIAAYRK